MTRILISDLGNVILPVDPLRAYTVLARAGENPEELRVRILRIHRELRLGLGGSAPEAFHRRVCAELGLQLGYPEFCRAWSDIFREDFEAIALMRQARVRRRLLLSNTDAIHWEWIHQHHPAVFVPFDRLFASHEHGLEKPDPEFYRLALRESGEPPEAHLFVDDIVENVEAARALGIDGILFRSAEALREEFSSRALL